MRPAKPFLAAVLLAAAPAIARDRGAPAATSDGAPLSCLRLNDIRETRVRDDRTIDFYTRGDRVYRNVLPQACSGLGFEEAFSYRLATDRLCSVDTIRVIQRASPIPGVTCGLGSFQPVRIAGPERR